MGIIALAKRDRGFGQRVACGWAAAWGASQHPPSLPLPPPVSYSTYGCCGRDVGDRPITNEFASCAARKQGAESPRRLANGAACPCGWLQVIFAPLWAVGGLGSQTTYCTPVRLYVCRSDTYMSVLPYSWDSKKGCLYSQGTLLYGVCTGLRSISLSFLSVPPSFLPHLLRILKITAWLHSHAKRYPVADPKHTLPR